MEEFMPLSKRINNIHLSPNGAHLANGNTASNDYSLLQQSQRQEIMSSIGSPSRMNELMGYSVFPSPDSYSSQVPNHSLHNLNSSYPTCDSLPSQLPLDRDPTSSHYSHVHYGQNHHVPVATGISQPSTQTHVCSAAQYPGVSRHCLEVNNQLHSCVS